MEAMSLMARLGIDISDFEEGLSRARAAADGFASSLGQVNGGTSAGSGSGSSGSVGSTSKTTFTGAFGGMMHGATRVVNIATAAAVAAGTMFVKSAVDTGKEFDKGISQVAATLGLETSSKTVQSLREYAIEMGEETVFTATEAAEALNYMALAGYDAERSMRVLPTVLNLAAAGALDLGYASDVVTDLGTALGLNEVEITNMTDQMAKTASTTNTNVGQLSEAMLRLGANGRTVAGGTEEIAAVFGVLADNGIKGAEAGTHLRNILIKLSDPGKNATKTFANMGRKIPSLFNKDGGMKDLPGYFQELKAAIGDLSDQQIMDAFGDLFNDRDIAAARALMETTPERWTEIFGKLGKSAGAAGKMAHEQLNNLAGDIRLFESAYQTMQIRVSDALSPLLRNITQTGTKGIKTLTENFEKFASSEKGVALMERMSAAFNTLMDKLTSTDTIESVLNMITSAFEGIASAVEFIANNSDTITTVLKGLAGVTGGLFVADKVTKAGKTIKNIWDFFGLGGFGGGGAGAGGGGAGGGAGGNIFSKIFGGLSGLGQAALGVLSGPVGGVAAGAAASVGGFVAMDAYATKRDYGDLNKGLAEMNARIEALEADKNAKSSVYADTISALGGLLDTLNEDKKNTFEGKEWERLSEAVESAKALLLDGSEEQEEKFAEIESLIDEMMNDPNAGANEELISSLGALLLDLETKSEEQVAKMTEDVNVAAETSVKNLSKTIESTANEIGGSLGSSIESGASSGAAAMEANLSAAGASAASAIGAAIQAALNSLHLPDFNVSINGVQTQHNARAMSGGRIFTHPTIFGYSDGAYQVAGDAGPEAVVGVNSLNYMIQSAVSNALAGVLSRMDELRAGQNIGNMKVVLDSGATVGGLVREIDKQMGGMARWRGGGRA